MSLSRELRDALYCAVFLAGYGNIFNLVVRRTSGVWRHVGSVAGPLALLATSCGWHCRLDRQPLHALGLHRRDWRGGFLWGSLAGAAMAVPPLAYFGILSRSGRRLAFTELAGISHTAFLTRLLLTTPLLVALVEEVAFRGLLQGKLQRALPARPRWALAISTAAFTLWHVAVNIYTLRESNVLRTGIISLPRALAGGLLGVMAGGLVFGTLFQRTGSLTAPILAHWLVDALMLLALYRQRPRA